MNLKPAIEKDNELQTSNAAKPPTASQFTILVITVAAVYSFGAARYRACASRTAGDVTIAALSAVIEAVNKLTGRNCRGAL